MATTRASGAVVEMVVATETLEVPDPCSTDPLCGRLVLAGQSVPAELLAAYRAALKAQRGPAQHKAQLAPARSKASG